jgi:hypothetical protein
MTRSDFMLFLVFFSLMMLITGCSTAYDAIGQIDTNGTYYKSKRKEPKYCQVTKDIFTVFVPCSTLKHDENI